MREEPQDTEARDTGCDLHPHCLTCPLPRCRHEMGGLWQIRRAQRVEAVTQAVEHGASMSAVLSQFHISRRTFFRDLGGSG